MSKLRYAVIVVLLLVSISLVVACTVANSPSSASGYLYVDEGIGPERSPQELVAEVAPAVVSIVTETVGYNWFWRAFLNSSPFQMP
jgi:S1-C subfamily serine protease